LAAERVSRAQVRVCELGHMRLCLMYWHEQKK
jgi:hypothetical protein